MPIFTDDEDLARNCGVGVALYFITMVTILLETRRFSIIRYPQRYLAYLFAGMTLMALPILVILVMIKSTSVSVLDRTTFSALGPRGLFSSPALVSKFIFVYP